MDRLTKSGTISGKDINELLDANNANQMGKTKAYYKLQEYEDMEEQGRLLKLPCKVGDEVYYILGIPNKTPCVIDKCTFELSDINKIGKTLFLTREEAEAELNSY